MEFKNLWVAYVLLIWILEIAVFIYYLPSMVDNKWMYIDNICYKG